MSKSQNIKAMKYIFLMSLFLSIHVNAFSQGPTDYLRWDASHKLTVDDFGIKKSNSSSGLSFASFSLEYNVSGLDFMTKNFNKKVKNTIIKSASWIDTTQYVTVSLRYQQTLFDIAEVYARKFRKDLKENRKQIAKGLTIVHDINARISSGFAQRRLQFDTETKSGTDTDRLSFWEQQVRQELIDLADYDYQK